MVWLILGLLASFSFGCLALFTWVPYEKPLTVYNVVHFICGGPGWWLALGLVWLIEKRGEKEEKERRYEKL